MSKTPKKPVIHVKAGGKSRPVRFGMAAIYDFCEFVGLTLEELNSKTFDFQQLSPKSIAYIFLAGFLDGAYEVDGETLDVGWRDVARWQDDMKDADVGRIMSLFAGALGDAEGAAEGKPEPTAEPTAEPTPEATPEAA
jgi:hypothetical protein